MLTDFETQKTALAVSSTRYLSLLKSIGLHGYLHVLAH